jgi:NAD(P)-dependent dehydrogenase (short-subunit alcohol dehydrogenase family)
MAWPGRRCGDIRAKLAAQVPLGRIGTVDDVAWAVIYLASEESAFMTGAEIKLDGGLSAM